MDEARLVRLARLEAQLIAVYEETCNIVGDGKWSWEWQQVQNTLALAHRELEMAILEERKSGKG